MTHIILYLIIASIIYAIGRAHGRKAVMGQARDMAQSLKDLLK